MTSWLKHTSLTAAAMLLLAACNNAPSKNHGPIVLGDSATIVTETDPQKLKDLVTDLQPVIAPSENKDDDDKKPEPAKDTAKPVATNTVAATQQAKPAQPLPNVAGLKAEFKDVSILVPGLNVKQAGNPNLQRASGAVYTLQGGAIEGCTIKTSGNVTKVAQRYQTVVVWKSDDYGTLVLDELGATTGWKDLSGNGTYRATGLDARSLAVPDADAGDIRDAVATLGRRRRWSRKKIQEMTNELRRVRNVNQKPLSLVLRSVMWKIDGKDANGRMYSKQIRVDVPM